MVPAPVVVADVVERRSELGVERPGAQPNAHLHAAVDQRNAHLVLAAVTCSTYAHRYARARRHKQGKGSPCSITERRVPQLIPVLGSQPASDVSHKPGGRLPLLSARPAVTVAARKSAATSFAAGEQRHDGCEQFA